MLQMIFLVNNLLNHSLKIEFDDNNILSSLFGIADKNINYLQNERVRPVNNYINSLQYINTLDIDYFLSTETLLIYKDKYLKQLSNQLDFPIDYNNINIYNILIQSFNEKYIKYIKNYWLDEEVKNISGY